jgi:protein ImuB
MERFTVPSGAPKSQDVQSMQAALALRRLRPPVQLTMQLDSNSPRAFFFAGKRYAVQEAYGPWRRSGEWWSEAVWSREEWDLHAVGNDGEALLCVVIQDLLRRTWQLEALYD